MSRNRFRTSAASGSLVDVQLVNLDEFEADVVTAILQAAHNSVKNATRALERDLEAQTRSAAKGNAWRAWKSQVYPRDGRPSYNPVGEVFGNGGRRTQGLIEYWSLPGTNRAVGNKYLAVPLAAALGTSLGRDISPRQWEGRFKTKLRPLFRPGKTPLLVADGALGPGGFNPAKLAADRRRGGQQLSKTQTIAVFALVEEQPHANRVSIGSAMNRANDQLVSGFVKRLAALR